MSTVKSNTPRTTGWVAWGWFAAIVLLIAGTFSAIQGLVAIIGPSTYYVATEGQLVVFDVTGWGWWNLIVGILLILTGIALFAGQTWARVVAIILAALSAIGQMLLLPAQPWWAIIVIAIDILVIYALTAHGHEFRNQD